VGGLEDSGGQPFHTRRLRGELQSLIRRGTSHRSFGARIYQVSINEALSLIAKNQHAISLLVLSALLTAEKNRHEKTAYRYFSLYYCRIIIYDHISINGSLMFFPHRTNIQQVMSESYLPCHGPSWLRCGPCTARTPTYHIPP
jgi:hypothetical protein